MLIVVHERIKLAIHRYVNDIRYPTSVVRHPFFCNPYIRSFILRMELFMHHLFIWPGGVRTCYTFLEIMALSPTMVRYFMLQQDEVIIAMLAHELFTKPKKKRKHRWWIHEVLLRRRQQGAYHNLVSELKFDEGKYQQYFRLTMEEFREVLNVVQEDLQKHCLSREVICPEQRLAICLR